MTHGPWEHLQFSRHKGAKLSFRSWGKRTITAKFLLFIFRYDPEQIRLQEWFYLISRAIPHGITAMLVTTMYRSRAPWNVGDNGYVFCSFLFSILSYSLFSFSDYLFFRED